MRFFETFSGRQISRSDTSPRRIVTAAWLRYGKPFNLWAKCNCDHYTEFGILYSHRYMSRRISIFIFLIACLLFVYHLSDSGISSAPTDITVSIYEDLSTEQHFDLRSARLTDTYHEPAFGFVGIPIKYSDNGLPLDRSSPFALHARHTQVFPEGRFQFRLRSKGAAQLRLTQSDQTMLLHTRPQSPNNSTDHALPAPAYKDPALPDLRPATAPHQEVELQFYSNGTNIEFELIAIIGGKGLVPSPGELSVSVAPMGEIPTLLSPRAEVPLTDAGWNAYRLKRRAAHDSLNDQNRNWATQKTREKWERYHETVKDWAKEALPEIPIPEAQERVNSPIAIDHFIDKRLTELNLEPKPGISDLDFLRRLSLDLTGRIPTPRERQEFLQAAPSTRRAQAIENYLRSPDWADHWVSYWQDTLAENPGILKPDLNNSGPFRWWLQQSFEDNIPMDRFAAELIQMQGSVAQGAPAAFAVATLNDAPMAAKADILIQAFQAEKLSCARCHDAPEHRHKQIDTFNLAAMLEGNAVELPKSSTVPTLEGFRAPRVDISLEPGQTIHPTWPFEELSDKHHLMNSIPLASGAPKTRDKLARYIVSPGNRRFAEVIVNRVWKRYVGAGLVEPAEDWEYQEVSHPELLHYLAREFTIQGYDLKKLARLILSSRTYQAQPVNLDLSQSRAGKRHFAGPNQRHLSAEQLVDSLFQLAGKPIATEELNLNPLGDRPPTQFLNLGTPRRSWQFAALMNERDRPSLALPSAQAVVDLLSAYGWRQSRMAPVTDRADDPSPLQTLILANGVATSQITRLTDDNDFTQIAIQASTLRNLVDMTVQRILTRSATENDHQLAEALLNNYFADRIIAKASHSNAETPRHDRRISWANHFDIQSNTIRLEEERQIRNGVQPTQLLSIYFREAYEDYIWALVNSSEFLLIP